jgi:glyoxylase-like metal-dependent hydrolase (beta-lactamase superfamily II)
VSGAGEAPALEERDALERDALERAAGAGIHRLAIPTPFRVGRVNAYLIEDSPLTLVDSGPNSGKALDELELALGARGHAIEDLELLVITHQHIDHFGLASILARRSGAEVAALDRVAPYLAGYSEQAELDDGFAAQLMLRNGIPSDVVDALRAVAATFRGWGSAVAVDRPLTDGGELVLAGRTLRVLNRPGHSPSDTVFLDESNGMLLAGDHLLLNISSNALLTRPLAPAPAAAATAAAAGTEPEPHERPKPLLSYIASLEATRAMELSLLLPGHGPPITGHVKLIDERLRLHERRSRKIHAIVAERPRTGYEIAHELWGNIAVTQAYLTLSEVLGHVDILLRDGLLAERESDGVITFATT